MAQYPNHSSQTFYDPPETSNQGYQPSVEPRTPMAPPDYLTNPVVHADAPYLPQPRFYQQPPIPPVQSLTPDVLQPLLAHLQNGGYYTPATFQQSPDHAASGQASDYQPPSPQSSQRSYQDIQADAMDAIRDLLRLGLNPVHFKAEGIDAGVVNGLMRQMSNKKPNEPSQPSIQGNSVVPQVKEKPAAAAQNRVVPTTVFPRSRSASRTDSDRSAKSGLKNKEEPTLSRADMIRKRLARLPSASPSAASSPHLPSAPTLSAASQQGSTNSEPLPVQSSTAMSKAIGDTEAINQKLRERIERLQRDQQLQREAKAKVAGDSPLPLAPSNPGAGQAAPANTLSSDDMKSHNVRKRPVALDFESEQVQVAVPAKKPFRRALTTTSLIIDVSDDESDEESDSTANRENSLDIAVESTRSFADFPILSEVQMQGSRFIRKDPLSFHANSSSEHLLPPSGLTGRASAEIERLLEKQREMEALQRKIQDLESKRAPKRPAESVTPALESSNSSTPQPVARSVNVTPSMESEPAEAAASDVDMEVENKETDGHTVDTTDVESVLLLTSSESVIAADVTTDERTSVSETANVAEAGDDNPKLESNVEDKSQVDSSDISSSVSDKDAVMSSSASVDGLLIVEMASVDASKPDTLLLNPAAPSSSIHLPPKHDIAAHFSPYDSPLKSLKSYKLNPSFLEQSPTAYRSLTFSRNINAMKEFCRFETAGGTCNDPGCEEQHFGDIHMTDQDILNELITVDGETPEKRETYRSGMMKLVASMRDQMSKEASASTPTSAQARELEAAIVNYRISALKGESMFSSLV